MYFTLLFLVLIFLINQLPLVAGVNQTVKGLTRIELARKIRELSGRHKSSLHFFNPEDGFYKRKESEEVHVVPPIATFIKPDPVGKSVPFSKTTPTAPTLPTTPIARIFPTTPTLTPFASPSSFFTPTIPGSNHRVGTAPVSIGLPNIFGRQVNEILENASPSMRKKMGELSSEEERQIVSGASSFKGPFTVKRPALTLPPRALFSTPKRTSNSSTFSLLPSKSPRRLAFDPRSLLTPSIVQTSPHVNPSSTSSPTTGPTLSPTIPPISGSQDDELEPLPDWTCFDDSASQSTDTPSNLQGTPISQVSSPSPSSTNSVMKDDCKKSTGLTQKSDNYSKRRYKGKNSKKKSSKRKSKKRSAAKPAESSIVQKPEISPIDDTTKVQQTNPIDILKLQDGVQMNSSSLQEMSTSVVQEKAQINASIEQETDQTNSLETQSTETTSDTCEEQEIAKADASNEQNLTKSVPSETQIVPSLGSSEALEIVPVDPLHLKSKNPLSSLTKPPNLEDASATKIAPIDATLGHKLTQASISERLDSTQTSTSDTSDSSQITPSATSAIVSIENKVKSDDLLSPNSSLEPEIDLIDTLKTRNFTHASPIVTFNSSQPATSEELNASIVTSEAQNMSLLDSSEAHQAIIINSCKKQETAHETTPHVTTQSSSSDPLNLVLVAPSQTHEIISADTSIEQETNQTKALHKITQADLFGPLNATQQPQAEESIPFDPLKASDVTSHEIIQTVPSNSLDITQTPQSQEKIHSAVSIEQEPVQKLTFEKLLTNSTNLNQAELSKVSFQIAAPVDFPQEVSSQIVNPFSQDLIQKESSGDPSLKTTPISSFESQLVPNSKSSIDFLEKSNPLDFFEKSSTLDSTEKSSIDSTHEYLLLKSPQETASSDLAQKLDSLSSTLESQIDSSGKKTSQAYQIVVAETPKEHTSQIEDEAPVNETPLSPSIFMETLCNNNSPFVKKKLNFDFIDEQQQQPEFSKSTQGKPSCKDALIFELTRLKDQGFDQISYENLVKPLHSDYTEEELDKVLAGFIYEKKKGSLSVLDLLELLQNGIVIVRTNIFYEEKVEPMKNIKKDFAFVMKKEDEPMVEHHATLLLEEILGDAENSQAVQRDDTIENLDLGQADHSRQDSDYSVEFEHGNFEPFIDKSFREKGGLKDSSFLSSKQPITVIPDGVLILHGFSDPAKDYPQSILQKGKIVPVKKQSEDSLNLGSLSKVDSFDLIEAINNRGFAKIHDIANDDTISNDETDAIDQSVASGENIVSDDAVVDDETTALDKATLFNRNNTVDQTTSVIENNPANNHSEVVTPVLIQNAPKSETHVGRLIKFYESLAKGTTARPQRYTSEYYHGLGSTKTSLQPGQGNGNISTSSNNTNASSLSELHKEYDDTGINAKNQGPSLEDTSVCITKPSVTGLSKPHSNATSGDDNTISQNQVQTEIIAKMPAHVDHVLKDVICQKPEKEPQSLEVIPYSNMKEAGLVKQEEITTVLNSDLAHSIIKVPSEIIGSERTALQEPQVEKVTRKEESDLTSNLLNGNDNSSVQKMVVLFEGLSKQDKLSHRLTKHSFKGSLVNKQKEMGVFHEGTAKSSKDASLLALEENTLSVPCGSQKPSAETSPQIGIATHILQEYDANPLEKTSLQVRSTTSVLQENNAKSPGELSLQVGNTTDVIDEDGASSFEEASSQVENTSLEYQEKEIAMKTVEILEDDVPELKHFAVHYFVATEQQPKKK